MTLKNDEKSEEELTCRSKIDIRNLTNFDSRTLSLKNLHFNGLLLTKLYNVWAKKVQRSYVWLHSRLIQSLKENWLLFPKLSKSIEELCLMALYIDAKFEGKMTCAFRNDVRNLANFHQSMFGSLKMELWWDPFIQSRKCISLRFTGEFCVMTMKNHTKFEEELTCQFKIDMRNLTNFDLSTQKSQKFAL